MRLKSLTSPQTVPYRPPISPRHAKGRSSDVLDWKISKQNFPSFRLSLGQKFQKEVKSGVSPVQSSFRAEPWVYCCRHDCANTSPVSITLSVHHGSRSTMRREETGGPEPRPCRITTNSFNHRPSSSPEKAHKCNQTSFPGFSRLPPL